MEPICFFVGGGQVMVSCWCQHMCLEGSTLQPLSLSLAPQVSRHPRSLGPSTNRHHVPLTPVPTGTFLPCHLPVGQACYLYFVATRREFSWEAALDRYVGRWEAAQLARTSFDTQRYARLKREVARLQDMLAAQRTAEAAAAAVAAEVEAAAEEGGPAGECKKEA